MPGRDYDLRGQDTEELAGDWVYSQILLLQIRRIERKGWFKARVDKGGEELNTWRRTMGCFLVGMSSSLRSLILASIEMVSSVRNRCKKLVSSCGISCT